jgi:hypothetical protein
MFSLRRAAAITLGLSLFTFSASAQSRTKRERSQEKEAASEPASPVSIALVEPPKGVEFLSGEANVAVRGNQNPVIRLGLSQNGVTMVEFPVADRFFALHPGNSDLVTIDESPTQGTDHYLVVRAGSGFASPATMASAGRAPVTSIIAQMQSGMVITFLFYPVQQLAQQAHRVVVSYDRNEVISARRAAGLAVNLDGADDAKPRTASVRVASEPIEPVSKITAPNPPTPEKTVNETSASPAPRAVRMVADIAYFDASQPTIPKDSSRSSEPGRAIALALEEAAKFPQNFKKWSDSVHGLSLSISPVRQLGRRYMTVVVAVRNTRSADARILADQPDLSIETDDEKGKPVQIELVKKLGIRTNATDAMIPGGETRYYALAYEAPILGVRQRLRVTIGQTLAADEPASATLTSSNR